MKITLASGTTQRCFLFLTVILASGLFLEIKSQLLTAEDQSKPNHVAAGHGHHWFETDIGHHWFETDIGHHWFETDIGHHWFETDIGHHLFETDIGHHWFETDIGHHLF